MNNTIKQILGTALTQLGWDQHAPVIVTKTKNAEHGDFTSNIALVLSKHVGLPPMKIARKIHDAIIDSEVTRIEVAPPGFINFYIASDFTETIKKIINNDSDFFRPNIGENKAVYLEYVSANPTGPLHVGHGRSAAYGSSLAKILSSTGFKVHTEYYVNDAGLQIDVLTTSLWLRILGLTPPKGCYTGDYLVNLPTKPEWTTAVPQILESLLQKWNEETATDLTPKLIQLCKDALGKHYDEAKQWIVHEITTQIKQDLKQFGVEYDHWFHESSLLDNNELEPVLDLLSQQDVIYEKEGAQWFKSTKHGDEKDRVIKRSNGVWTYFATDLAYHHKKLSNPNTQVLDIFGADHHGYTPRIKSGIKALGHDEQNFKTILIQFANLYRGKTKISMSTRQGQFVTLENLYKEVGVDAARYFYCMRKSDQHLDFDLELAKQNNNKNPVYYIQYAHARIKSILAKNGQYIPSSKHFLHPSDTEVELLDALAEYPTVLIKTAQRSEVYQWTQYCYRIATHFHRYYNNTQILSDDSQERYHRLLICFLTAQCLSKALENLGINAPESM
ncbi:arginine--tRNA ligase [Candidatus Comchoanobacter bicostacola]|uniref:Arginine--tRNA ligase n=1 Tax=Candidatus Comchoanobacter bicostacola TaxID=2919598 RepID=A0ABY5DMU7_9GAMM|nr:arginine--tRNA ligase [Candidatus Comchoanobacter bicostacola]UTC24829.1 arginine--tRNA ligase [Candidatus Comchoanobacter bicostacola]